MTPAHLLVGGFVYGNKCLVIYTHGGVIYKVDNCRLGSMMKLNLAAIG